MENNNITRDCHMTITNKPRTEADINNKSQSQDDLDLKELLSLKNINVSGVALTTLDLTECHLSDLPCALKNLPLISLNLSQNDFVKIPQCFYIGLDQLEHLDLSHNQLMNFRFEPNCCSTLKSLNISYNKFKNIPDWILNLRAKNLEELNYDCNITSVMRCIFDNSPCFPVRKLNLSNCMLRDEDLKFLKECKQIEYLDISNSDTRTINQNMLQNIDHLFIQPTWCNISVLRLDNLLISVFPQSLTWLETLTELYLCNNDFIWLPNDGLEFLVNLEILDLSHNSICSVPDKLAWLEHLRVLKVAHNKIEFIPDFSKMKSLETLDLYHNNLNYFNCNMENTTLKFIDLELNFFNTEELPICSYKDMKDRFRNLKDCDVRSNGFREMENDYNYSSSCTRSYASSTCDSVDEDVISVVSEDWDEELRLSQRHENVTSSDDEWKGFEENLKTSTPIRAPAEQGILINEDVIYCDAD